MSVKVPIKISYPSIPGQAKKLTLHRNSVFYDIYNKTCKGQWFEHYIISISQFIDHEHLLDLAYATQSDLYDNTCETLLSIRSTQTTSAVPYNTVIKRK